MILFSELDQRLKTAVVRNLPAGAGMYFQIELSAALPHGSPPEYYAHYFREMAEDLQTIARAMISEADRLEGK